MIQPANPSAAFLHHTGKADEHNFLTEVWMALLKKSLPVFLGLGLGYAYWHFIGCASGSCPITSTWYISTIYGGLIGATFLLPGRSPRKTDNGTSEISSNN